MWIIINIRVRGEFIDLTLVHIDADDIQYQNAI